jgi:hypothetical protein
MKQLLVSITLLLIVGLEFYAKAHSIELGTDDKIIIILAGMFIVFGLTSSWWKK